MDSKGFQSPFLYTIRYMTNRDRLCNIIHAQALTRLGEKNVIAIKVPSMRMSHIHKILNTKGSLVLPTPIIIP